MGECGPEIPGGYRSFPSISPNRKQIFTVNQDLAPKVNIARVGISNTSTKDVIRIFNEVIEAGKKIRVCVTPANCIVWGHKNERLRNIYNEADLTLCDGVPVLWASKFLGTPVKERITGLDLLPKYIEECYKRGHSFFLPAPHQPQALHPVKKKNALLCNILQCI